jgi:hypothetical protein
MDFGMKIFDVTLKGIKADEGKVLTNGETFSDVGGEIYLGKNDSKDNWHEITKEEAEERKKELELLEAINEYEETAEI